jgi:uncharacterized protein
VSQPGRLAGGQGVVARSVTDAGARVGWLLCSLGVALVLRLLLAGSAGAASEPAAALFALLMLAAAGLAGWRPGRSRLTAGPGGGPRMTAGPGGGPRMTAGPGGGPRMAAGLAWGVLGAAGLVAGPAVLSLVSSRPAVGFPAAGFPLWAVVVSGVAVAEEVLLRGALFAAVEEYAGTRAALVVTAVVFALVHVPLYGLTALPLDLAAGLWLGGLRIASGGVLAPASAHVIADLAGWWLW